MAAGIGGRGLALALALLSAAPGVAAAHLRWSPARAIAPAAGLPVAGIAADGSALAVWSHIPTTATPGFSNLERARVLFAAAPPGRGFARPHALADAGAVEPHVAVNSRGDAAVVWQRKRQSCVVSRCTVTLHLAVRRAGGGFGRARTIGRAVGLTRGPFAVLRPDRGVAVVWQETDVRRTRVMVSYAGARGGFSRPRQIGGSRAVASDLVVAHNGRGQAAAAWWVGDRSCVRVAVLRADGRFAAGVGMRSPDRCGAGAGVAVGVRGHVAVSWPGLSPDTAHAAPLRHHVAVSAPGRPRFRHVGAVEGGGRAAVAVAPDGSLRLYRTVKDSDGVPPSVPPTYRLETALRRAGGRLGPVQVLAAGVHAAGFELGVDARGRAVAAWLARGDRRIVAAHAGAGRAFGRPRPIGPADGPLAARLDLAVAAGGEAAVLWQQAGRLMAARAVPR